MYATYEDYTDRFRGRAIPDEATFDRLAVRADAVLDRMTLGRAAKYRDRTGKLALACCAAAEKLWEREEACRGSAGAEIAEEKVGDHLVRYQRRNRLDLEAELEALAEMYLVGTGLIGRGIPVYGHYGPAW